MRERQYKQNLTSEKASKGIKAALENALSLFSDAVLLFENKRYSRSIALLILAIEEAGKPSIIRSILLEDNPKKLKEKWASYRSHHQKNTLWIVPELISKGCIKIDDLRKVADENSDHRDTLENLKQLCLYTDVFSKSKWTIPDNIADENLAKSILEITKIIVGKSDKNAFSSKEELDIWVKHLKPVWKKEMIIMKTALINCYQECEDLQYIEKGDTKRMIEFLLK